MDGGRLWVAPGARSELHLRAGRRTGRRDSCRTNCSKSKTRSETGLGPVATADKAFPKRCAQALAVCEKLFVLSVWRPLTKHRNAHVVVEHARNVGHLPPLAGALADRNLYVSVGGALRGGGD